ncbi:MAG: arsenite methyltransferase [Chloroflexi bacterium]|nr:arsenite methyltransferase [Chloroflexota bacterium]
MSEKIGKMNEDQIKEIVRIRYAGTVKGAGSCCGPATPCCGGSGQAQSISKSVGYTEQDLGAVPEGANLGLGCGNPVALASLHEGDVVLDLGSGAGFDCFLAAARVGEKGRVIGVDMTPEMIHKARENARKGKYANVEFRLGEIENLPAADNSVDVVISNCVINLVPDKTRAFAEAFRVLKAGGRLMISDLVLLKDLPEVVRNSVEAYVGCLAGATKRDEYLGAIRGAGFDDVTVIEQTFFPVELMVNDPTAKALMGDLGMSVEMLHDVGRSVASVKVSGIKPEK